MVQQVKDLALPPPQLRSMAQFQSLAKERPHASGMAKKKKNHKMKGNRATYQGGKIYII